MTESGIIELITDYKNVQFEFIGVTTAFKTNPTHIGANTANSTAGHITAQQKPRKDEFKLEHITAG